MAFSSTLPTTLVIPSADHLILVTFPSLDIRETRPFLRSSSGEVVEIALSPVVGKGGLCAVLQEGGREVALVGLDSPDRWIPTLDTEEDTDEAQCT